ncbi:MAG: hypothetical protein HXX16_16900 [Bacteroidales bacterium]|nr:hypothetical protein [Bacteroidales bacterium]
MTTEDLSRLVIVPYERMEELLRKVERLSEAILRPSPEKNPLGDYMPEKRAKEVLSKQSTWFWNKRKSGELVGRKAGNQWYYRVSDIQKFIENGEKSEL